MRAKLQHVGINVLLQYVNHITGFGSTTTTCTDGDVRLEGGRDMFEGHVEMCDEGEWKSVCDVGWDKEEANVVCRQLGYNDSQANERK